MDELPDDREVMKMFYMTKGHLEATIETMRSCYWGYFKRAWYNTEFYRAEEGFDEAYDKAIKERIEKKDGDV